MMLPGGAGGPAQDWAPYPRLEDAVRSYLRPGDQEVALDALRGVLDLGEVKAFTLERVANPQPWGESLWQEIAVSDGRRLVLWHGDDEVDDDGGGVRMFSSSLRTIPLRAVVDQGLRTRFQIEPDGSRTIHTVLLYLSTQTPERADHRAGRSQRDQDRPVRRDLPVLQVGHRRWTRTDAAVDAVRPGDLAQRRAGRVVVSDVTAPGRGRLRSADRRAARSPSCGGARRGPGSGPWPRCCVASASATPRTPRPGPTTSFRRWAVASCWSRGPTGWPAVGGSWTGRHSSST